MEFLSKNEAETAKIAADLVAQLKPDNGKAKVIGLYGELGSGKTTFMKYLAQNLGIKDTVQSPTFVLEKVYELSNGPFEHLIHIDAYRIEQESEMIHLGWQEILANPRNLICIEWPERIAGIMPLHTKIVFEHISENERNIRIDLYGYSKK